MKRICWKRGMRLTDDIMRNSDRCTAEFIGKTLLLAASGRFGLIPSSRSFSLTLNVTKGVVDVESLSCLAVTKGGDLIDVDYDTRYTNAFDTRVMIPEDVEEKELILTVNAVDAPWKETSDGFAEPIYSFVLLQPNTPVPDNAIPIARIVDEYGWRMDDADFVPPCLLVSAHYKYEDLLQRFSDVLAVIDTKAHKAVENGSTSAIGIFWPMAQQLRIVASKERDLMTPMMLLSNVQKCVSAFVCACQLDTALQLADEKLYAAYVMAPYNYKDAYQRIKVGLDLCFSISEKVEKLAEGLKREEPRPQPQSTSVHPAPVILDDQLYKNCATKTISISVSNPVPSATVFYSTDGSEPSHKLPSSNKISLENKFSNKKEPEEDQNVTIKLKSILNGASSNVNAFLVTLHKDYAKWRGYEI